MIRDKLVVLLSVLQQTRQKSFVKGKELDEEKWQKELFTMIDHEPLKSRLT